jgi:hypothetical protein
MKKRKRVLRKANKKKLRLQSKNLQFKPKKKAREKVKKRKKDPEPESSEVETVIVEEKKIRRKYLNHAFTEADYKIRKASEEYKVIKEVEDLVLEAQRPGLRTYVISAGVLYGKGEAIFNSHFKKAWL